MSDTHLQPHVGGYAAGQRQPTLVYVGGGLGIAAALLGLGIFVMACFGFEAALMFSMVPLVLGVVGILLSIVGGLIRNTGVEDTHVLAALFVNLFAIVGGLLEVAAWQRWTILH